MKIHPAQMCMAQLGRAGPQLCFKADSNNSRMKLAATAKT
jgi:hypothetical protein